MFLPSEPVDSLTHERLLEWKASLQDEYAEGTVATHLKNFKAVLNWAVDQNSPLTRLIFLSLIFTKSLAVKDFKRLFNN